MSVSIAHGVVAVDPLPLGGTTGEVLVKKSNADYDVQWAEGSTLFGPKSLTIYQPGTTENVTMFYVSDALTLLSVRAVVDGTLPSVTYSLKSGSDRSSATTINVNSETVTNTTTGSVATLANATVAAGSWLWVEISATSGTVTFFSLNLEF